VTGELHVDALPLIFHCPKNNAALEETGYKVHPVTPVFLSIACEFTMISITISIRDCELFPPS
jgi:hypothetical protein